MKIIATVTLTTTRGITVPKAQPATLKSSRCGERQKRNLLATLFLSHGTPMLLAGDEFGHTQNGNNNAYAQDNETTWLDWLAIDRQGAALREFTRKLIDIRKAFPVLTRGRFVIGTYNEALDVKDVTWLAPTGWRCCRRNGTTLTSVVSACSLRASAGERYHSAWEDATLL